MGRFAGIEGAGQATTTKDIGKDGADLEPLEPGRCAIRLAGVVAKKGGGSGR